MPNFEGNRVTKTILGNREHKIFGEQGNKPVYFRGAPTPERASLFVAVFTGNLPEKNGIGIPDAVMMHQNIYIFQHYYP